MNQLNKLFSKEKKNILSIFTTAGYPNLNSTVQTVLDLEEAGVDLVEIGMPFSDPMADGPTIQESSEIALANGMSLNILFEQVVEIRKTSKIAIVLMGYLNPIYQYGLEDFLHKCKECKIDGLIIPDLSVEVYQRDYQRYFEQISIPLIFLITPKTSIERINKIEELSSAFIYLVSTASVTGNVGAFSNEQIENFKRIAEYGIESPVFVGFGIHDSQTFKTVGEYFEGAIVGSAFIRSQRDRLDVKEFVKHFKA